MRGTRKLQDMRTMTTTIVSKNGTEITLEITGTQEEPKITSEKFVIGGNRVPSCEPTIHDHMPGNRNTDAGLLFRRIMEQNVYVQCAASIPAIRETIAKLPHKHYWARKVEDTVDADGDICTVERWEFDKALQTEAGTYITESEMGSYLDSKLIVDIEIADAVKMWADEKEAAHITANEAGNARAKAMFDADEAEVGYEQACENADIPEFLR